MFVSLNARKRKINIGGFPTALIMAKTRALTKAEQEELAEKAREKEELGK